MKTATAQSQERTINLNAAGEFKGIYKDYVGLLQFIGSQSNIPHAEREEMVQESFLKLFKCDAVFTSRDGIKGFLAVTMRNQIIDRSRRAKVRRTDSESACEVDLSQSSACLWESDPEHDANLSLVGVAIDEISALPGGAAFGMFYRDGFSAKEIAAKTGEAVSSVTSRLCRLRTRHAEMIKARVLEG